MSASTSAQGASTAPPMSGAEMGTMPKKRRGGVVAVVVGVLVILLAVVGYGYAYAGWFHPKLSATCTPATLSAAGSTFIFPLMADWAYKFNQQTCIQVNYNPAGSGTGITDLTQKTVDLGASDAPLTPAQQGALPGTALTVPDTVGAVVLMYNVPGAPKGLNLTGSLVAEIFLGNVTNWNDPNIASINAGVTLPNLAISVVHRTGNSGTTFAFTSYLSADNPYWNSQVGKGTSVNWPGGTGEPTSGAVATQVAITSGGIGYAELNYAIFNNLAFAKLENPANTFVLANLTTVSAAAASVAPALPSPSGDWGNVTLLNQPGTSTYPLVTFSYFLVYQDLGKVYGSSLSQGQATALVKFLWWAVHTGQNDAPGLEFVSLPSAVVTLDESAIGSVVYNGGALTSH